MKRWPPPRRTLRVRDAIHRQFECKDCGVDTCRTDEYYMVRFPIWRAANGGKGMLCIGCLEDRLERKLTLDDFLLCPVNSENSRFPKSDRILDRMETTLQ